MNSIFWWKYWFLFSFIPRLHYSQNIEHLFSVQKTIWHQLLQSFHLMDADKNRNKNKYCTSSSWIGGQRSIAVYTSMFSLYLRASVKWCSMCWMKQSNFWCFYRRTIDFSKHWQQRHIFYAVDVCWLCFVACINAYSFIRQFSISVGRFIRYIRERRSNQRSRGHTLLFSLIVPLFCAIL